MKLTVLWGRLADYTHAFLRQLAEGEGLDIQLVYIRPGGPLKFAGFQLDFCREVIEVGDGIPDDLPQLVQAFGPEAVLMTGWRYKEYLRLTRRLRRQGLPVIAAVDNPWRGDLRQTIAALLAPVLLHPAISALYVAGERQTQFGRRLGFEQIFEGLYCCNTRRFTGLKPLTERPGNFLFVGRLSLRKGVDNLLDAYGRYRQRVAQPMGLILAGSGDLEASCAGRPGVDLRDFVQPENLSQLFEQAQCLILPSREEHWGVVLHEGATAGLPLIATRVCGAIVHYLRDGSNGYVISCDVSSLAEALLAFHQMPAEQRQGMSANSERLALTWTPQLQARHFTTKIQMLINGARKHT